MHTVDDILWFRENSWKIAFLSLAPAVNCACRMLCYIYTVENTAQSIYWVNIIKHTINLEVSHMYVYVGFELEKNWAFLYIWMEIN